MRYMYPVQFRVTGPDAQHLRAIAAKLIEIMRADPQALDVNTDWREMILSVRLQVDQDKARVLGIDAQNPCTQSECRPEWLAYHSIPGRRPHH